MEQLYVERAIHRVLQALRTTRKAKLARLAGIPESTIRGIDDPSWSPNATTLGKLERAAVEIEAGPAPDPKAGE